MGMYRKASVPEDFEVPQSLVSKNFILRPITINDAKLDFPAVTQSVDKKGIPDAPKNLTKEQNLIDLGFHQKEMQKRSSFTYIVLTKDEKESLGCVYIYPSDDTKYDVEVDWWITKKAYKKDLGTELLIL